NLFTLIIQIFDEKGKIISSSKKTPELMTLSKEIYEKIRLINFFYENKSFENPKGKKINFRFLTTPIFVEEKISYIVRVGISLRTTESSLNNLRIVLFLILPLTILFNSVISVIFTNITLNPINKMVDTINQITAGNLKLRIDIPESKDEMTKLADTFNGMLDRLDKAFSSQRKLVEDLSHELKTPLSIVKGEIEVALKRKRSHEEYVDILKSILEENGRIITVVENLLTISRFESKLIDFESKIINLNLLVFSIVNDMNIPALEKNIKINYSADKNLYMLGDENQIKTLFINMLDNSIKYSSKGDSIFVNLVKMANELKIEIVDTGSGISENEIPYIFDRYYRVIKQHSSKGFGIGLSIVKSIVETHKGKIEVKSKIGEGATFTIIFPANMAKLTKQF
nr:HAMP domain-containing sensor histidine kinase [Spirochaetota bacterium]